MTSSSMPSDSCGRALWVLRVAVAASCAGEAARMLIYSGPVLSWLWFEQGWSEASALRLEHAAAFALLACVPLLAWRKAWPAALVPAVWLLLVAVASTAIATWHPWLVPGSHAARYLAPGALIALSIEPRRPLGAEWLLRLAASATFLCHGIEALLAHAQFVDYVITGGERVGMNFTEATARVVLTIVGVVDIVVAVLVLSPIGGQDVRGPLRGPLRAAAAWMVVWGLATAFMRVVALGWGNWPEMLIRVTNALVPFTLLLLWRRNEEAQ
jgi:hypothetical protein